MQADYTLEGICQRCGAKHTYHPLIKDGVEIKRRICALCRSEAYVRRKPTKPLVDEKKSISDLDLCMAIVRWYKNTRTALRDESMTYGKLTAQMPTQIERKRFANSHKIKVGGVITFAPTETAKFHKKPRRMIR